MLEVSAASCGWITQVAPVFMPRTRNHLEGGQARTTLVLVLFWLANIPQVPPLLQQNQTLFAFSSWMDFRCDLQYLIFALYFGNVKLSQWTQGKVDFPMGVDSGRPGSTLSSLAQVSRSTSDIQCPLYTRVWTKAVRNWEERRHS